MKQTFTILMGLLFSAVAWGQDLIIEDGVLVACTSTESEIILPSEVKTIAANVFQGNTTLTTININEVTTIGEYAFDGCTNLQTIVMDQVTSIGQRAFRSCTALNNLSMPKVVTIGDLAFHACNALTSVTLPKSLNTLGVGNFSNCASLTLFELEDPAESVFEVDGGVLFDKKTPKSILAYGLGLNETDYQIPDGVTTIGSFVFYNNKKLTSVDFNNTLIIGEQAFLGCTKFTTIDLPLVKTVGTNAFNGCNNITSITLPQATSLGTNAFNGCTKLTNIDLPSVITIGSSAFVNCTALKPVSPKLMSEIMPNVKTIGSNAFQNCRALSGIITLPATLTSFGANVFLGCTNVTAFDIDNANYTTNAMGGVLFNKAKTTLVAYPPGKAGVEYTIPDGVTAVASYAFYGNPLLEKINATPQSLKTIGTSSFYGCAKLKELYLSASINLFGDMAYSGCPLLTTVEFVDANENFVIDNMVLFNANKTKLILYPRSLSETKYIVPNGVIEIANGAFYGCTALTEIEMPDVVTIGTNAFYGCSNLSKVDLPEATFIGTQAFYNCTKLTTVIVPKVKRINESAFYNCRVMQTIALPSVASIYNNAFNLCSALKAVDCSLSRTLYLGSNPFVLTNNALAVTVASNSVKSVFPAEYRRKYQVVVKTYQVSVGVSGTNGTVSATVNGQSFVSGLLVIDNQVIVSATPLDNNYTIEKWMINGEVIAGYTETTLNHAVVADATITVSFTEKPLADQTYGLNFNVTENGALTNNGGTLTAILEGVNLTSGQLVGFGKEVVMTATPSAGCRVQSWMVDNQVVANNQTNTYLHRIPKAASTVTVVYEISRYVLNYSVVAAEGAENNGTLIAAVDNQLVLSGNDVAHNKTIVFTATPDVGYVIKQWKVDGVVQGEYGKTLTLANYSKATEVTVEFEPQTYQLTFAVDGSHGTLAAKNGNTTLQTGDMVAHGSQLIFTATPDAGYRIKQWKINDSPEGEEGLTYEISRITEAATVSVEFEAIPLYTVTYSVVNSEGGQLFASVNGSPIASGASLIDGTQIDFSAQPDAGYEIKAWNDNGQAVSAFATYPVVLTKNEDITIEFNKKTFILTYVAGENGSITGETTQLVLYGGSGTQVLAVPDQGYRFVKWCDGVTDNPRTDANVTNNLILDCEFALSTDVQPKASMQVEVYPNPFVDQLNVNNATDIVKYSLLNAAGQVELQGANNGSNVIVIPVQTIKSGMIVLMLQTTDGKQTYHKLMKK
jgi:hypothetical protein